MTQPQPDGYSCLPEPQTLEKTPRTAIELLFFTNLTTIFPLMDHLSLYSFNSNLQ